MAKATQAVYAPGGLVLPDPAAVAIRRAVPQHEHSALRRRQRHLVGDELHRQRLLDLAGRQRGHVRLVCRRAVGRHVERDVDEQRLAGADVAVDWPSEDRMTMAIKAMGQSINTVIDVEEGAVIFQLDLPPALSFVEPMIRKAVEEKGRNLLG